MSALILISFMLPVFFARDSLLLRMGPAATAVARLRKYGVVLLLSTVLLSTLIFSTRVERVFEIGFTPSVTLAIVLFYILLPLRAWIQGNGAWNEAFRQLAAMLSAD